MNLFSCVTAVHGKKREIKTKRHTDTAPEGEKESTETAALSFEFSTSILFPLFPLRSVLLVKVHVVSEFESFIYHLTLFLLFSRAKGRGVSWGSFFFCLVELVGARDGW